MVYIRRGPHHHIHRRRRRRSTRTARNRIGVGGLRCRRSEDSLPRNRAALWAASYVLRLRGRSIREVRGAIRHRLHYFPLRIRVCRRNVQKVCRELHLLRRSDFCRHGRRRGRHGGANTRVQRQRCRASLRVVRGRRRGEREDRNRIWETGQCWRRVRQNVVGRRRCCRPRSQASAAERRHSLAGGAVLLCSLSWVRLRRRWQWRVYERARPCGSRGSLCPSPWT